MILYCAALPVVLCQVIVHKITKNNEQKCILLVDKKVYESRELVEPIKNLEKKNIFDKVILAPMFIEKMGNKEEIIQRCLEHFDSFFDEIKYNVCDFEKIYVLNDTWDGDINLFFNLKHISYVWIEIVKDCIYNKPYFSAEAKVFSDLVEEYKSLNPTAHYASVELMEESEKSRGLIGKGFDTWSCQEGLNNLDKNDLNKIIECFEINSIADEEKKALLIVNSYGYAITRPGGLQRIPYNIQVALGWGNYTKMEIFSVMDSVAIDYYAPEVITIYLKCHPHNLISNEKMLELYGEKWKTVSKIPLEFLVKYMRENEIYFQNIIGYASSALHSLNNDICKKFYMLGDDFFRTWFYYDSIYVCVMLAVKNGFTTLCAPSYILSQLQCMCSGLGIQNKVNFDNIGSIMQKRDAMIILDCLDENQQFNELLEKIHKSNIVCFINFDFSNYYFEEKWISNFIPLKIVKKKNKEKSVELYRDEIVWLFNKDLNIKKKARDFCMERDFQQQGVRISVDKITVTDSIKLFKQENSLKIMQNQYKTKIESFFNVFSNLEDKNRVKQFLRNENDIEQYFLFLKMLKSKFLIIFSVKDTPGNKLPIKYLTILNDLGFSDFNTSLWQMYIGIIYKNEVLYDVKGDEKEETVMYKGVIEGHYLNILSKAWRKGNIAKICIDDIDYAVNLRGINIVVYDPEKNEVIDSMGFDAHTDNFVFIHRNLD